MGASSILFPCWFVLILFGPIVYGENLRNGELPELSEAMKGEMQRLEPFSGRKFGYTPRFSTRTKLVSITKSREMKERGVLVPRRLLAENTTEDENPLLQKTETKKAEDVIENGKRLQIQAASSKRTDEIGQNPTKPWDGSVKEIPVMETIYPDHLLLPTLGGMGNNAERSDMKEEKLQDGVKVNSVQKPLNNRIEENNNNGSVNKMKDENPLVHQTGTKKAEEDTELGKKLQIQDASSKRTEEISQTSKKPADGSVKEIPVMETIHPDSSTLRGKNDNAESYEAKEEKLQDAEKVNSVQKPLGNRTEQKNNNGSVNKTKDESPFLDKAETKKAEDETEQGNKLQIQAASLNGTEEISQNPTKPEDVIVTIHPNHSTLGGKARNAERSEEKKEKLQDAEKVNGVQKPLNKRTEQDTNNGGENIGGEPAKDPEKITQAETLPNVGEDQTQELQKTRNSANIGMENSERNEAEALLNSAEIEGIGSGTVANSTGTGVQKIESVETKNLADSANLQIQNITDEVQKEERIEVEAIANYTINKMERMENTEIKRLTNSSDVEMPENSETITSIADNETQQIQSTEADRSANSTDAENEKRVSSEALSNSTEKDIQETLENFTEKEGSAESETLENPEFTETKQAESSEDSSDREAQKAESSEDSSEAEAERAESIEELSANSTDTMASTEFQDSTNSTATQMPWKAQNSTNNKDVEIQGPEDEYNDLIQEFTDLPSKLHDTAEKVADQLMPGIQKLSSRSKIYFSIANEEIAHGFRPLVGHHYAPFVASGISCIFLVLPLLVAIIVFEQIRAFFPLQKVIFLANIYLANYFATLVISSFIIGMEPLEFFYKNSVSGYIYLQLLQGLGFLLYLSLQCFNVVALCSKRTIMLAKLAYVVELSVVACIGLHYYVTVFHRAMAQKPPRTCWRVHGVYSLLFGILCLLSRIRHGKEYVQALDYNTHKKN